MHAQHHHCQPGKFGGDTFDELQAAHSRHRQIDDRQFKLLLSQPVQGQKSILDTPALGRAAQDALEASTDDFMVINDQYPQPLHFCFGVHPSFL